jgi:hypothetical protein
MKTNHPSITATANRASRARSPRASLTRAAIAAALLLAGAAARAGEIRGYFIGNSLTRGLSLDRLEKLYALGGDKFVFGTQTGAGTNLDEHLLQTQLYQGTPLQMGFLENGGEFYSHRNGADAVHKDYKTALQKETWDFLCLQPYLAYLEASEYPEREKTKGYLGDRQAASGLIRYALGDNPDKHRATETLFLYAAWPRLQGIERRQVDTDGDKVFSFAEFYAAPYAVETDPAKTFPNLDAVKKLMAAIAADNPSLPNPVRLIPAGSVLAALDVKIRAGQLPGIARYFERNKSYYLTARLDGKPDLAAAKFPFDPGPSGFEPKQGVKNFYCDQVHMNDQPHNGKDSGTVGAFAAACTVHAVLTGKRPAFTADQVAGIYEKFDAKEDAELIAAIQETAWATVLAEPLSGVKE